MSGGWRGAALRAARRIVEAFETAGNAGVVGLEGEMLDRPHLLRAEQLLARAKSGEDFAKLISEFSEDPDLARTRGELTFARKGPVPPEFEPPAAI